MPPVRFRPAVFKTWHVSNHGGETNAEIYMAAGVESSTGKAADRRLMCNVLLSGFAMDYTDSEQGQHELMQAEQNEHYGVPANYAETMDKLKDPDGWDVPGLIADVSERLRRETSDGELLAVVDTLVFRMQDICKMIDAEEKPNFEIISKVYDVAARLTKSR